MAEKHMERAEILTQEKLTPDIRSLWIRAERIADTAVPGQFLSVYCEEDSRILPRPISLCEIDPAASAVRLVYRIAGEGTREFSEKQAGDTLRVLGPLGNGFPLREEKALLVGGGIGIPPILELAKRYPGEKTIVLGYNDADTFLAEEFAVLARETSGGGDILIATMDGSVGTRGTVLDAIRACGPAGQPDGQPDAAGQADGQPGAAGQAGAQPGAEKVLYACGPTPMLRAVKDYAAEREMACFVSVEARMACGIGACLACVCRSTEVDSHTNVRYKRVCREGPVFDAREIEL